MARKRRNLPPMPGEDFLYLYVQPLRNPEEAGGFSRAALRRRGVAVAVTLNSAGEFGVFRQDDCRKLISEFRSATCVVGYNTDFDYGLLRSEVKFPRPNTLDLMQVFTEIVGRKIPLAEVARATFGRAGLADGNALTQAWREGKEDRVIRALKRKRNMIRRLHEHIQTHGWFAAMEDGKPRRFRLGKDSQEEEKTRRSMYDRAAETFAATARMSRLSAVRNPGTGHARVITGISDCENGMIQQLGRTGRCGS
jgi:hypothetical protein